MVTKYYDWTPVPAVHGTIVRPQNLPPWNPPPAVFGQSLDPHSGSGHPVLIAPAPPVVPLSFVGCTPSSGSTAAGFTITVTGTGFAPDIIFVVAAYLNGDDTSYPDEQTVVSDTQLIATWDPDSFYPPGFSFFLGGYNPPFPGEVTYSANKMFTNTA